MATSSKTVLITGATSGIGKACAYIFAQNGWRLILTGRRNDRLIEIKQNLETVYKAEVLCLCFDVRNQEIVNQYLNNLETEWQTIDLLINNAGLARGFDSFDEANFSDWEEMIDTNVKGLLYVSRAIIPYMQKAGKGHIINIGSTAAKEVYPKGNVYCATKHAVDALTIAMRQDLIAQNIKVSAIHPGFVETEFSLVRFHGDEARATKVYEGFTPLTGKDVAEVIYYMASAPANVNIADLVLLPLAQASVGVLNRK
jgi:NADP-dependent 3-hydroxy acid dehydrogenase YdfG